MKRTAYETCPDCRGYVMHINAYSGEVDDGCDYCNDTGRVRVRDEKGRFALRPINLPDAQNSPSASQATAAPANREEPTAGAAVWFLLDLGLDDEQARRIEESF